MASTYWILCALCGSVLGIFPQEYNNITENTCERDYDCENGKVCIDLKCEDPCLGVCGLNTICHVDEEVSMCSCKTGFTGQPFNGCYPEECTINSNCPEEKICSDRQCKDACKDACGLNSVCIAAKHRPVCSCSLGYVWKPFLGCQVQKIKCTRDSDCASNLTCSNEECVDPCPGVCGNNAVCNVRNHRPACACKSEFIGDPFQECVAQNTSIPDKTHKKYLIGLEKVNWYTAIERCNSKGMHLASIMSASEQLEMEKSYTPGSDIREIWTSGSDWNSRGHYVWTSSGKSFDYTHWNSGEPEVSDDYRCIVFRATDQTWMTGKCGALIYYACEYF